MDIPSRTVRDKELQKKKRLCCKSNYEAERRLFLECHMYWPKQTSDLTSELTALLQKI